MPKEIFKTDAESSFRAVRHPHISGVWCYRQTDEAYKHLRIGPLDFATGGAYVCAIADVIDVKPGEVLAFLQDAGYVTGGSGVAQEGIPAAVEHFGGSVLSTGDKGVEVVADGADLDALRNHLLTGRPAVALLDDSQGTGVAVAVALAGYDADRSEVLVFDPRGRERDGWYPWGRIVSGTRAFVMVAVPEEDHYSPRYIFKQVYGVDIAGHEQRWPDIDLEALRAINPDCIGWIRLGGTPLSYPIMKGRLDNRYYQTHNFSGEPSIHGAVSLGFANDGSFDARNLVFSAHRMKDYSMFKMLTVYDRPDFSEEHPCIDLLLGPNPCRARVFSAYHFPKGGSAASRDSVRVDFADDAGFERWVDQRVELSMHSFPTPSHLGQVATFRTCYGLDNDKMFVVHALLERATGS